jgi:hypothetical protein
LSQRTVTGPCNIEILLVQALALECVEEVSDVIVEWGLGSSFFASDRVDSDKIFWSTRERDLGTESFPLAGASGQELVGAFTQDH